MRILLAGDTHGQAEHVRYLLGVAVAEGCSRIFQLGDFGALEHFPAGVKFMDNADAAAREAGIDVYWLDGNHDKTSLVLEKYGQHTDAEGFLACRPRIRYVPRGHVWTWAGRTFLALGGAYSIDKDERLMWEEQAGHWNADGAPARGTEWFPEEEMTDEELDQYLTAAPSKIDVLLTHDKPRSSNPQWRYKDNIPECWPNQDRIQRAVVATAPELLVHGHLHWRYEDHIRNGRGHTRVVGLSCNPGSSITGRAKESWMVLDLLEPLQ